MSTRRKALVGVACIAWVSFLVAALALSEDEEPPVATTPPAVSIDPVTAYQPEEIAALLDELRALRESRLTPRERDTVDAATSVVGELTSGEAVISPATTTTSTTSTTTTTTSQPPPTTAPGRVPTVEEFMDADLAQLLEPTVTSLLP